MSSDNKCVNKLANSVSDNLSAWVCDVFQLSHDRREKLACIFYLQLPHHWLLVIRDAAEVVAGPSWKELESVKVFWAATRRPCHSTGALPLRPLRHVIFQSKRFCSVLGCLPGRNFFLNWLLSAFLFLNHCRNCS